MRWKLEWNTLPPVCETPAHPGPCVRVFQKWRHGTDTGGGEAGGCRFGGGGGIGIRIRMDYVHVWSSLVYLVAV